MIIFIYTWSKAPNQPILQQNLFWTGKWVLFEEGQLM